MIPYQATDLEHFCSGSYFMNVWGVDGKEMYTRAMRKDEQALEAYRQLGVHVGRRYQDRGIDGRSGDDRLRRLGDLRS